MSQVGPILRRDPLGRRPAAGRRGGAAAGSRGRSPRGGRPKPAPVIRLYTFFIDKTRLTPVTVQIGADTPFSVEIPGGSPAAAPAAAAAAGTEPTVAAEDCVEVPLLRVAHARSGDKGDSSNIAIFCRKPHYLPHLRTVLTPERIAAHFAGTVAGTVERFDAPGLAAVNFLIGEALGGGGMASRRIDPQGKAKDVFPGSPDVHAFAV